LRYRGITTKVLVIQLLCMSAAIKLAAITHVHVAYAVSREGTSVSIRLRTGAESTIKAPSNVY
jgi:hypothetical protein